MFPCHDTHCFPVTIGGQGNLSADLDLGPHIFSDDLSLPTISDIEELEFWHGRQHIFFHGNQNNVSCNVLDIAVSMVYELPKAKSLKVYGQSYVWDNLISRYLVYEPIRKLVINLG